MQLSCCNHNPETTVFAHSNYPEDGKGMGIKADDCFGAYMCSACHDEFDARTHHTDYDYVQMRLMFHLALKRTWRRLLEKGILK